MPHDHARTGSDWVAPDCAGMDFYAADRGLRDLLAIYLPRDMLDHLTPHLPASGATCRRTAGRAGTHRRPPSAGAASARPLRP